jgi:hypothetical protein
VVSVVLTLPWPPPMLGVGRNRGVHPLLVLVVPRVTAEYQWVVYSTAALEETIQWASGVLPWTEIRPVLTLWGLVEVVEVRAPPGLAWLVVMGSVARYLCGPKLRRVVL